MIIPPTNDAVRGFQFTARAVIYIIIVVAFGGFLFWSPAEARAKELSFSQALDTLLKENEQVLAAGAAEEEKYYEQKAAEGLYWPKLTATARVTKINDPVILNLNPIRDVILKLHPTVPSQLIPSFEETLQNDEFVKAQVNMVWPIFTGGKIDAANKAAEADLEAAKNSFRITRQSMTAALVQYYFGYQLVKRVADVRKQALDAMTEHRRQAVRLEQEGFISHAERLHADVAWSDAEREYKASLRDVEIAQTALKNILAEKGTINPATPMFIINKIEPVDKFLADAEKNHPVTGRIAALKEMAHQNVRVEESEYYPDVYLFGMRELHEDDLTSMEPAWAAGVGVNVTLFDGFSRPNKVRAARKVEEQAALLEKKAVRDIQSLITTRYEQMLKARDSYYSLEKSIETARENLRARKKAFEEGFATSLDVVDAQLSLSAVQVERLKAAYEFDVALSRLLEAGGVGELFAGYLRRADETI